MPAKRPRPGKETRFYEAWKICAAAGECDGWGGAESKRLFRLWRDEGCPALVHRFIVRNANRVPRRKP